MGILGSVVDRVERESNLYLAIKRAAKGMGDRACIQEPAEALYAHPAECVAAGEAHWLCPWLRRWNAVMGQGGAKFHPGAWR